MFTTEDTEKNTMKIMITAAALALCASLSAGDTTQNGPSNYTVDEGVTFTITNIGSTSFLLSWSDDSGTFTNIEDPTITIVTGQSYSFENTTSVHPFHVTDDTLPVSGTDGDYSRDTFDSAVINGATLDPFDAFVSNPGGGDPIVWTPADDAAGAYWYTCGITGHSGMTGRLFVEGAADCPADLTGDGMLNFFDVSAFLSAFTAMDPAADFTGDGMYNFFDVSAFLGAFTAGCP